MTLRHFLEGNLDASSKLPLSATSFTNQKSQNLPPTLKEMATTVWPPSNGWIAQLLVEHL